MSRPFRPARRRFLIAGAVLGGGLLIGYGLLPRRELPGDPALLPSAPGELALNAWLKIAADGRITIAVPRAEMGQGVYTALPMLVAEELDADWQRVQVEPAPLEKLYGNVTVLVDGLPLRPDDQGALPQLLRWAAGKLGLALGLSVTGGSTSVRDAWEPMRIAGASARAMLVSAAARRWGVAEGECRTQAGQVLHPASGRTLDYGVLAIEAARLDPPAAPPLKPRSEYRLLGTPAPRLDLAAKVDGSARFGLDVRLPGQLYAAIRHCPSFGGRLKSYDETALRGLPGVVKVVALDDAVAVVADGWWRAHRALAALPVEFDAGPHAALDTAAVDAALERALAVGEADVYRRQGDDPQRSLDAGTSRVIRARYRVPYLAHACLEPMNCTARVSANGCELWIPTQVPSLVRWAVARWLALDSERVTVHTTLLGGGFGRRLEVDLALQAAAIARHLPERPVQLIWSREEDLHRDVYRPAAVAELAAALDGDGLPRALRLRAASQSVVYSYTQRLLPWAALDMPQKTNAEGAAELPYAIPSLRVEHVPVELPVPVGFWRSVGHSFNAFFVESFIDELAHAAGRDPLDYRLRLLAERPRHRRVLERAAEAAGWHGAALPPGRGRGLAVHESFGSIVAQVAEIDLRDGRLRVERVVCAVDCGPVVNPDTVRAQMESGIIFGLSAALYGAITLRQGGVEQSNFPDYPLLAMADTPAIEVHILTADDAPLGGVGEVGVPPIAPAVVNAVFAATGERWRRLPLRPPA
ncbi:MAG TPA: xanthine dehydrogenase family protein molybdopterin-binding subunit [Candidatus Competibacteraceae bacterium]|nr:xanthine dehydrogenase family protein molybdopterin-binding subunit [Candidatus Competibacteraceae bacterium]